MDHIKRPTEDAALRNIAAAEREKRRKRRVLVWHAKEQNTFAEWIAERLRQEDER